MKNRRFNIFVIIMLVLNIVVSPIIPITSVSASSETTSAGNGFDLEVTTGSAIGLDGTQDIELDWDPVELVEGDEGDNTEYFLFRKDLGTKVSEGNYVGGSDDWELRGKYGKDISVLNVYPDVEGSNQLQSTMTAMSALLDTVNIDVTPVKISDFNENPSDYLHTDSDGRYNYESVVFGFWDSNNHIDISEEGAEVTQAFIDADGGVIFGHDTFCMEGMNDNFNNIVESNTSMRVTPNDYLKYTRRIYSEKIQIVRQSSATTYPFNINGLELTIPMSHTIGQIPTNQEDRLMSFEPTEYTEDGQGPYFYQQNEYVPGEDDPSTENAVGGINALDEASAMEDYDTNENGVIDEDEHYNTNAYLMIEDNVAMIQAGHSSGNTGIAEQKVLANTIYAVSHIYIEPGAIDQLLDVTPPDTPTHTFDGENFTFNSSDKGNSYAYRVVAVPVGYSIRNHKDGIDEALNNLENADYDDGKVKFSKQSIVDVDGALKEYRYYVDDEETGKVSGTEDVTDDDKIKVLPLDGSIPVSDLELGDYIHIAAYDQAYNISETHDVKVESIANISYVDADGNKISNPKDTDGNKLKNPEKVVMLPGDILERTAPAIAPEYKYVFKEVRVDGTKVDKVSLPLTMLSEEHQYNVEFVYDYASQYDVHVIDGVDLGVELEGIHYAGEDVSVVPKEHDTYTFTGFKEVIKSTDGKTTLTDISSDFTMPDRNVTLLATYERTLPVGVEEVTGDVSYVLNGEELVDIPIKHKMSGDVIRVVVPPSHSLTSITINGHVYSGDKLNELEQVVEDGQVVYQLELGENIAIDDNTFSIKIAYDEKDLHQLVVENTVTGISELIGNYYEGQSEIIHAPENAGYDFVNWTSDDVEVKSPTETPTIITMPDKDVVLKANYKLKEVFDVYVIDALDLSVELQGEYNAGNEVTVIATTHEDAPFTKWISSYEEIESDLSKDSITFNMPSEDVFLIANYDYSSVIDARASVRYGVVLDETGKEINLPKLPILRTVEDGEEVAVKIPEKFIVTGVTLNNIPQEINVKNGEVYVTLDDTVSKSNRKVDYKYNIKVDLKKGSPHTLTISNDQNDDETTIPDLYPNQSQTITAPKIKDYTFVAWEPVSVEDDIATIVDTKKSSTTAYMPNSNSDAEVRATYKKSSGGGSITTPDDVEYKLYVTDTVSKKKELIGLYEEGESASATASKYENYSFVNWTSSDVEIASPTEETANIVMPANDVLLVANYSKDPSDLTGNMVDPYINGYPDKTMHPNGEITRAEVVKIMYNLYGDGYAPGSDPINSQGPGVNPDMSMLDTFSDVNKDTWYSEALAFCLDYGVVSGYPDGTFRPNENITRAELAQILGNFIPTDVEGEDVPFTDVTNSWAIESIEKLYAVGVISGYEDNTFHPTSFASRAEVVTMTNTLLGRPETFENKYTYTDLLPTHWAYKNMMNAANGSKLEE